MKVKQIISKNKNGNQMEVIGKDGDTQRTLHIHRKNNEWKYFTGLDKNGTKIFSSIRG